MYVCHGMYRCIYVCMYVCHGMYACMYVRLYVTVCLYVCMFVCMFVCMYVCQCVYVCHGMYVCMMYVHVSMYLLCFYGCKYVCLQIRHMHVLMCICPILINKVPMPSSVGCLVTHCCDLRKMTNIAQIGFLQPFDVIH